MKHLFPLLALALVVAGPAHANTHRAAPEMAVGAAASAGSAPTGQQNKMVVCQKQAGEQQLEGPARQAYVTDCLRNKPAPTSQGSKLGACSKAAAAKGLKGEERNKYLSECGKA